LSKQETKATSAVPNLTAEIAPSLKQKSQPIIEAMSQLATKLFPHNRKQREIFFNNFREIYFDICNTEVLILHSPGGWGNAHWNDVQDWEKSIVTGVTATIEEFRYSCVMRQYLRSCDTLWGRKSVYKEAQSFLFGISYRAQVLAEELKFLTMNLPKLRIVLVGASQGASFNNMVMMKLDDVERIYSIELGTFFPHMSRRQLTERNLAIDSNGFMNDPMCHRDLWTGAKSYFKAFARWFDCQAQGKHVKFTQCINTPGHEYRWEYPEVHGRITEFLTAIFGEKR
jgi:hypothetical protein